MASDHAGAPQIGEKMRELTLTFGRVMKAKTAVHHRRKQSSTNAGAVVAGDSPVQVSSAPREDTIDSYGFEISITTDQRDDLERCAAQQAKQLVKWQDSSVFQKILPPEDRLKKLCRKGIPPQYRKWVWLKVSGAEKRRLANGSAYYKAAVEAGRENTACAHQIKLDVPRTFPSCPWVQSEPGQVSLSRVLFAFAHHNPTVGYCQGMNYVVALLLVALGHDEEAAFWVLVSLIDDDRGILYQDMYAKDLSGCHVEMRSLKELVALKLPRLATHLEELHCDMSIVATDWFLCLFCTSLPAETAIRVWDALLHEGTKVLFRVGLALLKMNEPLLLVADNPGDLLRVARNAAADEFDRDELMRVAFDGLGSLPMEKIKGFRDTNQRKVDKEMAAREMRANLRAAVKEGYVLTEAEAALLNSETEDDSEEGSEDSASRGGSSWKRFGTVLGERTKATLDAGKQKMKQLRSLVEMGDQGHTPSDQILGADEMDIDDDLQVAIMLSMQQDQPPDQGQPSNATAPQETSSLPPPPQSQAAIQAAQLQHALLQAFQQPQSGGIPAQATSQQAQGSVPPLQTRQQAPAPPSSAASQPAWVKSALQWPQLLPAPLEISIPLSLLDPESHLNTIFFSALGKSFTAALGPAPTVVTWKCMNSTVSRIPSGENVVMTMQHAWLNAAPVNDGTTSGRDNNNNNNTILAASVVNMLRSALALRAVHTLSEDEDDLYFEGGKSMALFMQSLEEGRLAPSFLDAMALASSFPGATSDSSTQARDIAKLWTGIFKEAFKRVQSLALNTPAAFEFPLRSLDLLTQGPALRECLATILLQEAASGRIAGKSMETQSIFAPLLRLSALPILDSRRVLPLDFPAKICFTELRNYPRHRGSQVDSEIDCIRSSLQRVYTAAYEIFKRVATLKELHNDKNKSNSTALTTSDGGATWTAVLPPKEGKEVVAAWFAEVTASNHHRSEAGSYIDRVLSNRKAVFESSSDAFLVGATAVALRFCRPFMATTEKKQGALVHLNPRFYRDSAFRVKGVNAERTLAGTLPDRRSSIGGGTPSPFPAVSPDGGSLSLLDFTSPPSPHFVAEMFFATQRLIRVGFVPAIYRYQCLSKMIRKQRSKSGADADADGDNLLGDGSEKQEASLEEWLLIDSVRAVLADPAIGNDLVQFCELTARWIQNTVLSSNNTAIDGGATTSLVPESVVRDMCVVLQHFIQQKATELLGGIDISTLIKCLTGVLRATDSIPSPAVHYSVIQLLVAMLSPQLGSTRRRRSRGVSAAEAALISAVLGTGAAQTELLPSLIAAYAHADHVVGLDVDHDAYDKFTMRTHIDILLMELWRDPACAKSLDAVAMGTTLAEKILFSDFCGSVLNDLIYLLKDSLGRLEDIATLERSMGDKPAWEAQHLKEKQDKLKFYRYQQRSVSGFMSMALTTLDMLNTLVASKAVQTGFVAEEIAPRAAGAAFHFIDLLVGPRCAELAVLQNKQQYHFDPDALLLSMLHITLRLAEQPSFVNALSEDVPDYDRAVLEKTVEVLKERQLGEYEHRARLEGLMASVDQRRREINDDYGSGDGEYNNKSDAGDNQGAVYDEMLASEVASTIASKIEERYTMTVGPFAVGEFDSSLPRAYNRHFSSMAETAAGDVSKAAKRISRELRDLSGKMALPVFAGGALLVRHDIERLDKVRALITGPEGTPYESGCFFFDVFFPPQYPQVPPLMILETTGGGVARFNPNLYSDGKVCLSLLGTWHAGNDSEKWNSSTSTLWQVLISIQSQVLVPQPYYNEPAYEGMKGTVEGDAASLKYNAEIWLNTMRFAMADVLKHPRVGYEEAIKAHFKTLRPRIVKRMAGWVQEAAPLGAVMQKRLEKAAAEVKALLAAL